MQYADGGDLRNYLKNNFKKLTWNDKKKLASQIAEGLNYLHNEDVLHRDLVSIISFILIILKVKIISYW
jgi:serine/threonine protein kinase